MGIFLQPIKKIIPVILYIIITVNSLYGQLQIVAYQPGVLIIEFNIDSLWIKDNSTIATSPLLPVNLAAGFPQLPHYNEVIIGIPESAAYEIYPGQLQYIASFQPEITQSEKAKGIDYTEETPQWSGETYPTNTAILTPIGKIRGHASSALKINPVIVVNGGLNWYKSITVQIIWNHTTNLAPKFLSDTKLSQLPLNRTPIPLGRQNIIPDYQYSESIARISLDSTGWYQVTYSTLIDSGLAVTGINPKTFRLWNHEQEIRLYIDGEDDQNFNSGDQLIFYGEKNKAPAGAPYINNFYTAENVYWLTWGSVYGLRYVSESAYPALPPDEVLRPTSYRYTEHFERDEYFARLGNMHTHDQWDSFDHFFIEPPINGGTSEIFEIPITYPVASTALRFTISMELQGITTGNHSLQAFINSYKITDGTWDGQDSQVISSGSQQILQNDFLSHGPNQLLITLDGSDPTNRYDQVYLNWVEIEYARQYQAHNDYIEFTQDSELPMITQFEVGGFTSESILVFKEGISRLQDFLIVGENTNQFRIILQDQADSPNTIYHAIVMDSLLTTVSIAPAEPLAGILQNINTDYLIIAPDSFTTILEPLATFHNGTQINIDDIYRYYNGGVLSPYAIKDFLFDAYHNLDSPPSEVLIAMQGGVFGWAGGYNNPNSFIPSMKIQTYGWGAASSDFWYTLVAGDDLIPEFNIGRLPARDQAELELMVQKTLSLVNDDPKNWHNQLLMIAGYEEAFKNQSESLINNIIQEGVFPTRLNIDKYSEGGPFYGSTDTLLNHFSRGLTYINFLGHGGGAVWGDRSLFTLGDINNLYNPGRTPFVTSMTCFTGDVTNPNALGRRLMGYDQGGVAAWFGSAGVGWIINDFLLLQPLHENLFNTETLSIGEIISQAKIQYYVRNSSYPDIAISQIYQFNLSGDPGLKLPFPAKFAININPPDPEPGETVTLTLPHVNSDSLKVQLFTPDQIPLTKIPQLVSGNNNNYQLPISDTLATGNYSLVASWKSNGDLFRSNSLLSIAGANAIIHDIIPSNPNYLDSILIVAKISAQQGIDTVQLYVNNNYFAEMHPAGSDIYQSTSRIPPQHAGALLRVYCRVVDGAGNVTFGPEKQVLIRNIPVFSVNGLKMETDPDLRLMCTIINSTSGSGDARILFQRKLATGWYDIGSDTINFYGRGDLNGYITCALPSGIHDYRAIVSAENPISIPDTFTTIIVTNAFWVTPELGTTDNLNNHSLVTVNDFQVEIMPGLASEPMVMEILFADDPAVTSQPDFNYIQLAPEKMAVSIETPNPLPFSGTWHLPVPIPDSLFLAQYFHENDLWLPVKNISIIDSTINFSATTHSQFAFIYSTDNTAPKLEATINGQRFLRNSYLNNNPIISLIAQDKNGIDHRINGFQIWINDQLITNPQLDIMSGKTSTVGIRYTPVLTGNDTTMAIIATDAAGNQSDTLALKFIVSEKLQLIDYGNFPNPFTDQTRFAYELTETVEEFSLDIYTVDGRKIRHMTRGSTLTDLDPTIGAYHEIIWDGRDKNGDFVANGVYFYRIKVKNGKTVIEKRGKIAKAR